MPGKQFNGSLYCLPENKGKGPKTRTSKKWCPDCKMHKRGPNHNEGKHHKTKLV